MQTEELKEFLEAKVRQYNQSSFIKHDPVQIPHLFNDQQDIEIAGFFSAVFSWGQRATIIKKSRELLERMDMQPFVFIKQAEEKDLAVFDHFAHRTFNSTDCRYFVKVLQHIFKNHDTLGSFFQTIYVKSDGMAMALSKFKQEFFSMPHEKRTEKHIADPLKGSTANRLNMFLRWMVRKDEFGVDFGLWKMIPPSALYLPLDIHSAHIARELGLLSRNINDWKAVEEVTENLKKFDPEDPVKYDYALFGTGVFEKL
ncbi:MAG: TIGR02757 family protein [Bacteroidales bacterium]|nr:TIGR02757 family protein [Bacteroidales bacterium]